MRKIRFRGLDLRVLDDKAEAAIRAGGEFVVVHCCVRVADCTVGCDCGVPAPSQLGSYIAECPGCGHRIWVTPPLPKTLLPIMLCNQCTVARFQGQTVDAYLPPGWTL